MCDSLCYADRQRAICVTLCVMQIDRGQYV